MMKHFGTLSGVRRGCYPATVNLSEKSNIWAPYREDFMSALGQKRTSLVNSLNHFVGRYLKR
jgi:hypothetical protein